jgi:hypothetical protein
VHWASDVVAGVLLGWAWFVVCAIAFGGRRLQFAEPIEKAAAEVEHASHAEHPQAARRTAKV